MKTEQEATLLGDIDYPDTSYIDRPDFGHIGFETLANTRDLGGMKGDCGRTVKSGKLLRSGTLSLGSDNDIHRICHEYDLRLIVDFRNCAERSQLPDPVESMPGANYVVAEILSKRLAGITQERNMPDFDEKVRGQGGNVGDLMTSLYPKMLTEDTGIHGYRLFLDNLLDNLDHTSLWHCHLGRDRCGMGSILVETMLGVGRDEILDDYLATNLYVPESYSVKYPASVEYFEAVEKAVEPFGGFMGYITNVLGITKKQIIAFRKAHLES